MHFIEFILYFREISESGMTQQTKKQKIVQLALSYNLASEHTRFVKGKVGGGMRGEAGERRRGGEGEEERGRGARGEEGEGMIIIAIAFLEEGMEDRSTLILQSYSFLVVEDRNEKVQETMQIAHVWVSLFFLFIYRVSLSSSKSDLLNIDASFAYAFFPSQESERAGIKKISLFKICLVSITNLFQT